MIMASSYLHKGELCDSLFLRYEWSLLKHPSEMYTMEQHFTIDNAMVCHMGGFLTIRHNEIRNITASLLTEVCRNVVTEPPLQPSGEQFPL